MAKKELIDLLTSKYNMDKTELRGKTKEELLDELSEFEDHSDMFPNDDEYDGSYSFD